MKFLNDGLIWLVGIMFVIWWCITGCTNGQVPPMSPVAPPAIIYQFTLGGHVDGNAFTGTFVGEYKPDHQIKIESATDVNMFTVQTCSRFDKAEDVIKTGWFRTNRGYEYDYSPTPGAETGSLCVVRIGAYTKEVGAQQAHAIGAFKTPDETLPAKSSCNGDVRQIVGLDVCSSMDGLVQQVEFPVEVITAAAGDTSMCKGSFSGNVWSYPMPLSECVIEFMEKAAPHRIFRYVAAGINSFKYQGD